MRPLLAGLLALIAVTAAAAGDPVLLFPAGDAPVRLRLEVTADGKPPDAVWATFLDRLFDHFDRDGDGFLSPAEAGRVFPLPLPGGRDAAMGFKALDADASSQPQHPAGAGWEVRVAGVAAGVTRRNRRAGGGRMRGNGQGDQSGVMIALIALPGPDNQPRP